MALLRGMKAMLRAYSESDRSYQKDEIHHREDHGQCLHPFLTSEVWVNLDPQSERSSSPSTIGLQEPLTDGNGT